MSLTQRTRAAPTMLARLFNSHPWLSVWVLPPFLFRSFILTHSSVYGAVYTLCANYKCGAAAAPSTTKPPAPPPTTAKPTVTSAPIPAACSSVVSIANRCANGDEEEILSCLCHDASGKTNTQVQNWASSCLPYAKSEAPEDVTGMCLNIFLYPSRPLTHFVF